MITWLSLAWRAQALVLSLAFSTTHLWATENIQTTNSDRVRHAFENWQQGKGSVFDLLAPDATWTVTGSSAISGVYTSKTAFLEQAVRPVSSRLATPIVPTVQSIVTEDDVVVVLWNGEATTLDRKPYKNTYLWHMTFKDGQITRVIAFLDTQVLEDLIQRVKPALP